MWSRTLCKRRRIQGLTLSGYKKFAVGEGDFIAKTVERFLKISDGDASLNIAASLKAFSKSLSGANAGQAFAKFVTLLNKLDVAITLLQKQR